MAPSQTAAGMIAATGLITRPQSIEVVEAPYFIFHMQCLDADGRVKWEEEFRNVVTRAGAAYMLDMVFAAGAAAQTWFLGLIGNTGFSAVATTDTAASHAGWTESTVYSQGTRPSLSWSAATTGSNNVDKVASSAASFSINGSDTIKGCFVITNSTKSGTTGTLYSAGTFTDRIVSSGDTLNVTPTLRLAV